MKDSTNLARKRVEANLGKIPYCGTAPLIISGCGLAITAPMEGQVLMALFGVGIAGTSSLSAVLHAGMTQETGRDFMAQDERSRYA